MNERVKILLLVGMLAVFLMVLFPPWQGASYSMIFSPPSPSSEIDFNRLGIQFVLVGIACGALWLALPSADNGLSEPDSTDSSKSKFGKHRVLIVSTVIMLSIILPIAWGLVQDYQKRVAAERAAKEAQRRFELAAQLERQRLKLLAEEGYRRDEENRRIAQAKVEFLAEQQRLREEQAQAEAQEREAQMQQQVRARRAQLAKLATPKTWKVGGRQIARVKPILHTYWKDGQLYYCLELKGAADALEYAMSTNPSVTVSLQQAGGVSQFSFAFPLHAMGQKRSKSGAMVGLISAPANAVLAEEIYNEILQAKMD